MRINSKVHKIFSVITYVLAALMALFIVFLLVSKVKKEPLFIFGRTCMWVKSGSMADTIPAQSYVLVKKATAEDVKTAEDDKDGGDVIVFVSDDPRIKGELNTHRAMAKTEDGKGFITKGDNNLGEDNVPARAENVRGIYIKNLPVLTALGRFCTKPAGITVMVLLILAMMVFIYFKDIAEVISKDKADGQKQAKIDELVKAEVEKLKAQEQSKESNDNQE